MNQQPYAEWRDATISRLLAKKSYDFDDLCTIITILRGEGGCPWDREQDHHSIRKGMIEECYEVVEAIDRDDPVLLREELGDVLLQIVFHADIEKDAGRFDINDVTNDECVKMIHRHPHVFGEVSADTSEQVLLNWEAIKTEEKKRVSLVDQLEAIPPMLPALMRAQKVSKKTKAGEGMPCDGLLEGVVKAVESLKEAQDERERGRLMGEILFDLTTACRKLDLEAEEVLTAKVEQIIHRAK